MPTAEEAAAANALYRAMNGLPADPLNTQIMSTPAGQSYQAQINAADAAAEQAKHDVAFSQPRNDLGGPQSAAFIAINSAYQQQQGMSIGSGGQMSQTPGAVAAFSQQPGYVQNNGVSTGRAASELYTPQPFQISKYSQELANQPSRSTVPISDISSSAPTRAEALGYTNYEKMAMEAAPNRPGYYMDLGDSYTRGAVLASNMARAAGFNIASADAIQGRMLSAQRDAARSTSDPKDDRFYTGELQKWGENKVELSSTYHHLGQDLNVPIPANRFEYAGDLAVEFLKGKPTKSSEFFSPVSGEMSKSLVGGEGLQQYAWNAAKNPVTTPFFSFGAGVEKIISAEGQYGPYGKLWGGPEYRGTPSSGTNVKSWEIPVAEGYVPFLGVVKSASVPSADTATPFTSVGKSVVGAPIPAPEEPNGKDWIQATVLPTIGGVLAQTPIGKIINNWSWESAPLEETTRNIAATTSRGTEGLLNTAAILPFVGAEATGVRTAIGAISPLAKGTIAAGVGLGSSLLFGKVTEGPSQPVGEAPMLDLKAVPVINLAAIPASWAGVNTKISANSEPGRFLSYGSGGIYKTADSVLGILPGNLSLAPASLAITVPSKTPLQQFEVGAPTVTVSGGSADITALGNWLEANKGRVETKEQADYYNKYVSQYNDMAAANPTITTTTKNMVTVGSPDKVYKYGQWDIYSEKAGDVFRNLAGGYTPEQMNAYGETIKNKGLVENAVFGVGKFMSERPLDVLPSIAAGTVLYLGGEGIGAGLGMAAKGTGAVGTVARALSSPTMTAIGKYGVPLYFGGMMGWGVTEGLTATPQQTARNIGESAVPGVGMLWGAALPSILPSLRFGGGGRVASGGDLTVNPRGPSPVDTGFPMTPREYSLTSKLGEGELTLPQFNKFMGIKGGATEATVNTGMSSGGKFLTGEVPRSAVPTIGENLPTFSGGAAAPIKMGENLPTIGGGKVGIPSRTDALLMSQSAWQDLIVKNPDVIKSVGKEPLYNIAIARGPARLDYMRGTPDEHKLNYLYGGEGDYFKPEFNFIKSGTYGKTVEAVSVGASKVQKFGGMEDYWTQVTPSEFVRSGKEGKKMYVTFNSLDAFTPDTGAKLTEGLKSKGFSGAFKVPTAGIDAIGRYEHIVMYEGKPGDLAIGENIARDLWGKNIDVSFGMDTGGKSSTELKVEAMRQQLAGRATPSMISMRPIEGGFATTGKWGGMKLVPEQVWKPTQDYTNYARGGGVGHFLDTAPTGWFKPAGKAAQIETISKAPRIPTDIERYATLESMMGLSVPLLETTKAVSVRSPWFSARPTVSSLEVLPTGVRVKQAIPSGRESDVMFKPGTMIPNAPEAWTTSQTSKLSIGRREAIRIDPRSGEVTVMGMRKEVRSPEGGKVFEGGRTQFNLFNLPGGVGIKTPVDIKVPSTGDILSVGFKKGTLETGAVRDVTRAGVGSVYHYENVFADVSPVKVGVAKQTREVGKAISDILASKAPETINVKEYAMIATPKGKVAGKVNIAPSFDMGNVGTVPTTTVKMSAKEPVVGGMNVLNMEPQIGKMDVATARLRSMFGEFAPRAKPKVKSMGMKMAEAKVVNAKTVERNKQMFAKLNAPVTIKSSLPNIGINLPRVQLQKSGKVTEPEKTSKPFAQPRVGLNIPTRKELEQQYPEALPYWTRSESVGTANLRKEKVRSEEETSRRVESIGKSPKKEKQSVGLSILPSMAMATDEANLSRIMSSLKTNTAPKEKTKEVNLYDVMPDSYTEVGFTLKPGTRVENKQEVTRLPYVDTITKTITEPAVTPKTKTTVEPTYDTKPDITKKPPVIPIIKIPGMPAFGGGTPSAVPARAGKKFREIFDYNFNLGGAARSTSNLLRKGSNIPTVGTPSIKGMGAPVKYKSAFNLPAAGFPKSLKLGSSAPKKKGKKK